MPSEVINNQPILPRDLDIVIFILKMKKFRGKNDLSKATQAAWRACPWLVVEVVGPLQQIIPTICVYFTMNYTLRKS